MKFHPFENGEFVFTLALIFLGLFLGALLFHDSNLSSKLAISAQFLTPLIASALGGLSAYWAIRRKQLVDDESDKVKVINTNIFKVKYCIDDLYTTKRLYSSIFNDPSEHRGTLIPRIMRKINAVDFDVSDLYFLTTSRPDSESYIDLSLLDSSYRNFNGIVDVIATRNCLYDEFVSKIENHYIGEGYAEGLVDEIKKLFGESKLDSLLHLSETLIQQVDNTLINLEIVRRQLVNNGSKYIDSRLIPTPNIVTFTYDETVLKLINEKVVVGKFNTR